MRSLIPALILATNCFVHADFVIEERVESADGTYIHSMKIKGKRLRMDMPAKKGGATALIDGNTGQFVSLVHKDKVALISTVEEILVRPKQLELEAQKKEPKSATFELIGKEKIGEWNCDVYARTRNGITHKKWLTKAIAIYPRVREQMKSIVSNVPGFNFEDLDIPDHVVVKRVVSGAKGSETHTVLRVSEELVPETEFVRPAGYREIQFPPKN